MFIQAFGQLAFQGSYAVILLLKKTQSHWFTSWYILKQTFPLPATVFLLCSEYVENLEAAFLMFQMNEKVEGYFTLMFHKAQTIRFRN